ncbi:MAG: A/G-specific adenine glycosylase [Flavobacteriaceae bacterium]
MAFSRIILKWYSENKRLLPWRSTKEPYKIWLSEIILQQTRVAQGTPYYLRFVETFPTVHDLSGASEEQVLKLWQGLGYYSRARNLHATAKMVVNDFGGIFPGTYNELLKLRGIGDYTASAIASICFDEPQPVVDGNVYRVLARYFGIEIPINSAEGIKYFKELAREVMDGHSIRDYNQAIMEFGAVQCTPKKPNCLHCPLNTGCVALKNGQIDVLPVKVNKTKVKNRYFNYLVFVLGDKEEAKRTVFQQRKGKGIWQNLWEFPLLESEKTIGLKRVEDYVHQTMGLDEPLNVSRFNDKVMLHKLSHQHLHTFFWIVESKAQIDGSILISEIDNFAVPVLVADFIETFKMSYF